MASKTIRVTSTAVRTEDGNGALWHPAVAFTVESEGEVLLIDHYVDQRSECMSRGAAVGSTQSLIDDLNATVREILETKLKTVRLPVFHVPKE